MLSTGTLDEMPGKGMFATPALNLYRALLPTINRYIGHSGLEMLFLHLSQESVYPNALYHVARVLESVLSARCD